MMTWADTMYVGCHQPLDPLCNRTPRASLCINCVRALIIDLHSVLNLLVRPNANASYRRNRVTEIWFVCPSWAMTSWSHSLSFITICTCPQNWKTDLTKGGLCLWWAMSKCRHKKRRKHTNTVKMHIHICHHNWISLNYWIIGIHH